MRRIDRRTNKQRKANAKKFGYKYAPNKKRRGKRAKKAPRRRPYKKGGGWKKKRYESVQHLAARLNDFQGQDYHIATVGGQVTGTAGATNAMIGVQNEQLWLVSTLTPADDTTISDAAAFYNTAATDVKFKSYKFTRKSFVTEYQWRSDAVFDQWVTVYTCCARKDIPKMAGVGGTTQTIKTMFDNGWANASPDAKSTAIIDKNNPATTLFQNVGFTSKFKILKVKKRLIKSDGGFSEFLSTRKPETINMGTLVGQEGDAADGLQTYIARRKQRFWVMSMQTTPCFDSTAFGSMLGPARYVGITKTRRHYVMPKGDFGGPGQSQTAGGNTLVSGTPTQVGVTESREVSIA